MRLGSLFAGIGGFDLAARWMGWETAWFSEVDPYASAVLAKHWPGVPNHGDATTIDYARVELIDLLCGGFPCQPFSSASRGRRSGTQDDRFLWPQMCRAVAALRPRWVLGENVTQFDGMGLEQMVLDLESLGYEVAPPLEIPACAVGRDHRRQRLWILGHTDRHSQSGRTVDAKTPRLSSDDREPRGVGSFDGLPTRMDRLAALGNAIVPQCAFQIFQAIAEAEAMNWRAPAGGPTPEDGRTTDE